MPGPDELLELRTFFSEERQNQQDFAAKPENLEQIVFTLKNRQALDFQELKDTLLFCDEPLREFL